MKYVFHIPYLGYSLLSVSKLDQKGMSTTFSGGKCTISKDRNILACGELRDSLYCASLSVEIKPRNGNSTMQSPYITSLNMWHQRLCHVHAKGIYEMVREGVVKGIEISDSKSDFICESCTAGKEHRSEITKVTTSGRADILLDLVRSDVGGPMQVESMVGLDTF